METKLYQIRAIRNYAFQLALKSLTQMLTQMILIWLSIVMLSGTLMEYISSGYFLIALVVAILVLTVYLYTVIRIPKFTAFVNKTSKEFSFKKPLVGFTVKYQSNIIQLLFWHLLIFVISIKLACLTIIFSITYRFVFQNSSRYFKRIISSVPICLFAYIFLFVTMSLINNVNDIEIFTIFMTALVMRQIAAKHASILRMEMNLGKFYSIQ